MTPDRANHLARTFGCTFGSMPFTYLGLPLGTTKPSVSDFSPLMNKIERRLAGVSRFLSYHGRFILVNSIFSSLPTFYMCSLKLPPKVVKQIDIYTNHCLWSKGDINRKGTCLVAWEEACKPKAEGGLGIIDIKTQNNALLMKFLDKFFRKSDVPWVSLTWEKIYANHQTPPQARNPVGSSWWKEVLKLYPEYQTISTFKPNRGDCIQFWVDIWGGHGQNLQLKDMFPELFSFCRKTNCSLQFFVEHDIEQLFITPLSQIAVGQLERVEHLLMLTNANDSQNDVVIYSWGTNAYSSKKAYKQLCGFTEASPLFNWLWASSNTGTHKFFFWLLLRDRLNSRNLLRRKHMHLDDYSCILCNLGIEETSYHLFFLCSFSTLCWNHLNISWDPSLEPLDMVLKARADFGSRIFREVFITGCWALWLTRNSYIFDHVDVSFNAWKARFIKEFDLVCIKAKPRKKLTLTAWRDSTL